MAYYTKVLQADEKVLVVGRLHWSIYGRAIVLLLLGGALLLEADRVPDSGFQHYTRLAAAVVAVLAVLMALAAWIKRHWTEIVVTDRRVIFKQGLVSRHT